MDNFPLLNLFLTMLYLFLWVAWIILLFRIIGDIFRSHDLSGGAKAAWTLLILVLPWLGALIYLVVRGSGMYAREVAQQDAVSQRMRELMAHSTPATGQSNAADQLAKLADLRQSGVLTEEEFATQKAKVLA